MTVTLWHISISHYSEKVRWALDHKRVPHTRRAPAPGLHPLYCLWLTRGRHPTLPILELDGRRIGDSSAILAALEERYPDPPLMPEGAMDRSRALELEEWLDEEVAPRVRRLGFHEFRKDPELFAEVGKLSAPALFNTMGPLASAYGRTFAALRYGAGDEAAVDADRAALPGLLDRLAEHLDGRDYLVGDRFTVADLTAAAVLYPLVLPPQTALSALRVPEPLERFRAPLLEHPACVYALEMYHRHR